MCFSKWYKGGPLGRQGVESLEEETSAPNPPHPKSAGAYDHKKQNALLFWWTRDPVDNVEGGERMFFLLKAIECYRVLHHFKANWSVSDIF